MILLGIDTSYYSSVGTYNSKTNLIINNTIENKFSHLESLTPLIKKTISKQNNIEEIIVTIGPASFMGLRIGIAYAKALSMGFNISIKGVNTIDVLAKQNQTNKKEIVIDAKRSEVYYNYFNSNWDSNNIKIKNTNEIKNGYGSFLGKNTDFAAINAGLMCKNIFEKKLTIYKNIKPLYIREPNIHK